jgi:glycosyltransferase involved in cell wall biosynthesis
LLLEAAHQLGWTNTRIRIAGTIDDPVYWNELLMLAKGLSVEFVGPLAQSEMADFYRGLDVLVLSSRWPENLPFVLLEAQAAQLAVIGSDVPGISHRIPDPKMRFKTGSASSLARAMGGLMAASLQASSPAVSHLREMASATESVYQNALASSAKGQQ